MSGKEGLESLFAADQGYVIEEMWSKKPLKHSVSRKVFRMYFSFRHGIRGLSQEELRPCRLSLKECFAAQILFQLQNALYFARVFGKIGL